jgi:hypothetical protein
MIARVLQFVRLPFLLLMVYTIARFSLGCWIAICAAGNQRLFWCSVRQGWRLSVGRHRACRYLYRIFAEILIFQHSPQLCRATQYRCSLGCSQCEGTVVPMGRALATRAGGLLAGQSSGFFALGRALGPLAPDQRRVTQVSL